MLKTRSVIAILGCVFLCGCDDQPRPAGHKKEFAYMEYNGIENRLTDIKNSLERIADLLENRSLASK